MVFDFGSSIHLACWMGVFEMFAVSLIPFFFKKQSVENAIEEVVARRYRLYWAFLWAHALWTNGTAIFGYL